MLLGVSTGSCYPFFRGHFEPVKMVHSLSVVEGVEVILAQPRTLANFNPKGRTAELLREFDFVNLHYPFARHQRRSSISEKKLVKKVVQLDKAIGFKHVVLHPDAVLNWRNFQSIGINFLLENMELGTNRHWQKPSEMKSVLKETGFGMCFDLNHAMSCGIKPEKFLGLKGKIKQVHVNSTNAFGKAAEHRFLVDSSKKSLGMAKQALKQLKHATWIIEAMSKKSPTKKIEREARLLEKI